MNPVTIRNATTEKDWDQIREICCLTGMNGNPIAPERFPFFGAYWTGAYELLEKPHAFVAVENTSGRVLGYITGARDTKTHDFKKTVLFHPKLLIAVLARKFPMNSDAKRFLKRFFKIEKPPEAFFSDEAKKKLVLHPSHLHINLREEARKSGIGALLLDALFEKLKSEGSAGIHLYCGDGPVKFYVKNGFELIEKIEFKPGVFVNLLGRRF